MSYLTQSTIAADSHIHERAAQCAAQEDAPGDPDTWVFEHRRELAASPGWAEAWESAVAGEVPEPGKDPGVITDGMILSAVQGLITKAVPAE